MVGNVAKCPLGSVCDEGRRLCLPDGSVQMGDVPCGVDDDCLITRGRCRLLGNKTGFCLRGSLLGGDYGSKKSKNGVEDLQNIFLIKLEVILLMVIILFVKPYFSK